MGGVGEGREKRREGKGTLVTSMHKNVVWGRQRVKTGEKSREKSIAVSETGMPSLHHAEGKRGLAVCAPAGGGVLLLA